MQKVKEKSNWKGETIVEIDLLETCTKVLFRILINLSAQFFGKGKIYSVIALWKLEKLIVRKAPAGAFRYYTDKLEKQMKGGGKLE